LKKIVELEKTITLLEGDLSYYKSNANRIAKLEEALLASQKLLVSQTADPSKNVLPPHALFQNGTLSTTGGYWSWNEIVAMTPGYFQITTTSYTNDTIIILQGGLYDVRITTAACAAANFYSALYVNGNDVSRSYNSANTHYNQSFYINRIMSFKPNDKLNVYQTHSNTPLNGNPYNSFAIMTIGN